MPLILTTATSATFVFFV